MSDGSEQLFRALAGLVDAGTQALQSYTKLQEKRAEFFANAATQAGETTQKPFEQFEPGYFERAHAQQVSQKG